MATYKELRALFGNGDLGNLVEVACIVAVETIFTEDAGTPNHANRVTWAKQTLANTRVVREQMLMLLLAKHKDLSVEEIRGVSPAVIQTAVNGTVDVLADGT